jgi:site-specific DNA-methyltransferase (adenine-specific)
MINLMHGDCLERMKEILDGSVDMILTDPPYGTTQCKWDSIIPLEPMWEQLKRIIKPNGAIVMTASQPFTTTLISSNIKMFKYCWVWDKNQAVGFLNAWKQPLRRTEDICVFYFKQCLYNPQIIDKEIKNIRNGRSIKTDALTDSYGKYKNDKSYRTLPHDKTMPVNLININRVNSSAGKTHPTQKPVGLMEYLIKTYTNEGETVLDFTMGSGTTGVAAKNLNRNFIGIELDETYFNIAEERINNS